jgi:hypothetical protein
VVEKRTKEVYTMKSLKRDRWFTNLGNSLKALKEKDVGREPREA